MLQDIDPPSAVRKLDCPPASASASIGNQRVPDRDQAAGQDVGAQAAAMDERTEEARTRDPLEVGARLAQAPPDALGLAELEVPTDERVEPYAAGDDVAPSPLPRDAELVERLRFDECQLVAAPRLAERPAAGGVTVALQASPCDCNDRLDRDERRLGLRRDEDPGDRPDAGRLVLFSDAASEVERRDEPARFDRSAAGDRVSRIEQRARGGAEHEHSVIAFGRAHPRKPLTGPVKAARLGDGNEAEIPLGEPLSEEEQRLGVRKRRLLAQDLGEAGTKLGLER